MASPPTNAPVRLVPLSRASTRGVLRLAVAIRPDAKDDDSALILLRSGFATRVYLGATLDAAARVIEWLELWVQTVAGLAGSAATWRDYVSNAQLDQRWSDDAARFAAMAPDAHRHTGWETTHPEPLFIDLEAAEAWQPVDAPSGQPYRLCTDDALLDRAGLPRYGASLHRYWFATDEKSQGGVTWIAATPDAPVNPAARAIETVLPPQRHVVALNAEGGLMHARRFAPLGFEEFVNLLSGQAWPGLEVGAAPVRLGGLSSALGAWDLLRQEPGNLWLRGRGRIGTIAETFHLRVELVHQIVRATAEAVARSHLPLLNLSAESFRINLGTVAPGLPLLWSMHAVLAMPGQALALPLPVGDVHTFLPLAAPRTTIFRPEYVGLPVRARGLVRLRRVTTDTAGQLSVEGTLVTSEKLALTPLDLVWIKLPLPTGALDLFARVDPAEGLAVGETRFRTEPQILEEGVTRALRAAEGNAYNGTEFETVPMLSTPCDLYALGVLAVRTLLVNSQNTLGVALDEVLSLARQIGVADAKGEPVARVRALVAADPRWRASLGPQRLSHEPVAAETIGTAVPEDLWWAAVTLVARMFPAQGTASYCRSFADVPAGALERVFGPVLADLEKLLLHTRGLLFSDWAANREVAAVLARVRA